MKKLMMTVIAAALATFAEDVPVPNVPVPDAKVPAVQSEEMEPGALCKTYAGGTDLKTPEQLQELLMNAKAVDQGYDTKAIKFDAKNIGRHPFGVAVWEGFLDAPVAGEFTFTVTGSGIQDDMSTIKNGKKLWFGFRPYIVSVNGKGCTGREQYTFKADLKKGLNKVYSRSCETPFLIMLAAACCRN